jgi:thioredoxin 1
MSALITIKKFGRPGCRPCAILSNYLSEIDFAASNAELVEFNTDDLTNEELDALKIGSVPVLRFERNGLTITEIKGLRPVEEIVEAIELAKVQR